MLARLQVQTVSCGTGGQRDRTAERLACLLGAPAKVQRQASSEPHLELDLVVSWPKQGQQPGRTVRVRGVQGG